ncbi:MAG: D-2-hydroxyacid dehydrogenase family protein [Alphaproteobacteria bacterium]|nr:D-2-hydroxyacid dehydrogenase family protein [Alphaproteobacteria bacterium]
MRIAILDDYQNVSQTLADWSALDGKADITVFNAPLGDEDAVAAALAGYDVVVCMRERTPVPASLIEQLDSLKLIVTTGMRNRSIDTDAARARGIPVCGTPGLGAPAGELAWALIISLMKNIPADDRSMRNGEWQPNIGLSLGGKTLSVIGLGKLGAYVANVGLAFDMNVVAWSQNLTDERAAEVGVKRVSKEEALSQADVLTIQLILSDRSRGLIGAPELALMKPTAFLVNTSRGPIVDEAALIDALREKRIAGAGLDVYDVEPLPVSHPLRTLENTILTPHTGYVTAENLSGMYQSAAENIAAFIDGDPIRVLNG